MSEEVTDTNEAVTQGTDTADKETTDLDSLLNEFDTDEPEVKQEPVKEVDPEENLKQKEIYNYVQQQQTRQFQADLQSAINVVKEAAGLEGVDDDFINGYLQVQASKDKRLTQAWIQREANPEGFKKVLKAVGERAANSLKSQPDKKLTDNISSLRHAVSTTDPNQKPDGPTATDINQMSDSEFFNYQRKLHGSL